MKVGIPPIERIDSSAMRSSSRVVTPGFAVFDQQRERLRGDLAAAAHDLDLARRFDRNHGATGAGWPLGLSSAMSCVVTVSIGSSASTVTSRGSAGLS
jgi:hypothetical protein